MSKPRRSTWLKVRVTPAEHEAFLAKAAAADMSLSELMRDHLGRVRVVNRSELRDLTRQLARIGSNLNQLARWVNTYKHATEALLVLRVLAELRDELRALAKQAKRSKEG